MSLPAAGGAGPDELIFSVNGRKIVEKNADPEQMLLSYLRKRLRLTGTKYGCGGGGCGACTVMISTYEPASKNIKHYSANACLLPICSLHGVAVTTVEGVGCTKTRIHPVQERLAKCHGSQCGFCTPGMVMSMYTLLRNHPEPSMEQIAAALAGNLCRCTGYRPILDGCKTFCKEPFCCQSKENGNCCLDQEDKLKGEKFSTKLFSADEFQPLDPTQEFIFPPELMTMAENQPKRTLVFQGERTTWISPASLKELLELKAKYPKAPLVVGNTSVGPEMKFKGVHHPVIISPARILDLNVVRYTDNGLSLGAACSLAVVKDALANTVSELPGEKTKIFRALLHQLKTLGGQQIRNISSLGGNIMSRKSTSDLNPILAVGNCTLNLASREGTRWISLSDIFANGVGNNTLMPEEVLVSVHIPHSRKGEFVSAFRQAQRRENALPIANAGMRVLFAEGTDIITDFGIFYGGIGSTTVCAKHTCQALIGRHWNEQMLDEACRLVLKEVSLPGSAPGGKVEYRRTLIVSFLFKFYLQVLQSLNRMDPHLYPDISEKYGSVLQDFQPKMPQSEQIYQQEVNPEQLPRDPVGRPIMHQGGIKHATGEAVYCDDIRAVDEELFLAVITSSRAHAKIVSIDTSEALKAPGVFDIITARDVPATNEFYYYSDPEIIFAKDKVICVGQIVCGVVADSDVHAKQAAAKVKIEYEDLEPVILTVEEAIKHNSFFEPQRRLEQGNVDEAFETVDQILEGEIHIGGQEHFYMETQCALVVPKGEDKEMDVYVSTQHPALTQEMVASCLGVPANRIMCHVKRIGGAFGGKVGKAGLLACVAAVAANKTGRAVRFILDRGNDMLITGGRHPLVGKYKVGFMNDGRIMAADAKYYINGGCTPDDSVLVAEVVLLKMDNAYKIPNLRCCSHACKTNLPSNTAFRGFGFPQSGLITESWITAIAAKSGLSAEKVREINMYKETEQICYIQELDPENLVRCWNECMEKSEYYSRKTAVEEFNKQNYWKKKGIAIIPMKFPFGLLTRFLTQAAALVHIYMDGSVLLTHGGIEMGQGIHTKMIQVASRELKIPMSSIHFCETSTTTVPNACASVASAGTDVNGMAVKDACQTLLKRLEPIISKNPKGTWNDWVKEAFEQSINLSATGYFRGYEANMDWEKGEGHPFTYFIFGAACSEVEIDCLTGDHKNIRTDIVIDIGCSINPAVDIGQIEGAFVQGIGLYTMEELKYSPEGVLYTRGPDQYKIPAICDIPEQFSVSLLSSSQNPYAIYSSKGIGEAGLFLGCSVFFAIWDAVAAVRKERGLTGTFTLNSPLTPERIRMACADQFTELILVLAHSVGSDTRLQAPISRREFTEADATHCPHCSKSLKPAGKSQKARRGCGQSTCEKH
ncbi:aldehyde oxidase 1-like isoform X1 [Malaclemys terrapin pileata]|uniref:aldehyde oxidase 1-like isoform X1 n=1 Tax=Malaclemys terrapin pileata TaxID=2991368 RepID=UPI0023A8B89C|nr:aldehyde oxidase 1-like isoform X1 [Malaclemys terrapin pileata]